MENLYLSCLKKRYLVCILSGIESSGREFISVGGSQVEVGSVRRLQGVGQGVEVQGTYD